MSSFFQNSHSQDAKGQSVGFLVGIVLCCLLAGNFSAQYLCDDSRPVEIGLDEKINPNVAASASLVRLPNIGVSRAEAIIAYRQKFKAETNGGLVFGDCNDLQKVKGIGPKTADGMRKWLTFK